MRIRIARKKDIQQIQLVRNAVNENVLSDPTAVTEKDCEDFICSRGKGWVCEIGDEIVGFSIVDLKENNVWALFIKPEYEKMGIGQQLHDTLLNWYFKQTKRTIWLGTSPNTRAEQFYRKAGWKEVGIHGDGEIKFEMGYSSWGSKK